MKSKLIVALLALFFIISCNDQNTSNKGKEYKVESEKNTTSDAISDKGTSDGYVATEPANGTTSYGATSEGTSSWMATDDQAPVQDNDQAQQQKDPAPAPPKLIPTANADWDKKIIKTATLRLEVKDFNAFNGIVHKTVRQYGGYVAQEDNDLNDRSSEAALAIKVPVHKFEDLMNGLSTTDAKLLVRKISTEDVTGEVVDIRSRLVAKKEMRQKYMEFLKQSKNMKEVLEVQAEINNIQEQIESATARVEYLGHQSAYSTINLSFFQPLPGYVPEDETPSFFKRVALAFTGGAEWIKNLLVGMIYLWPLLLCAGVIFYLFQRNRNVKAIALLKK